MSLIDISSIFDLDVYMVFACRCLSNNNIKYIQACSRSISKREKNYRFPRPDRKRITPVPAISPIIAVNGERGEYVVFVSVTGCSRLCVTSEETVVEIVVGLWVTVVVFGRTAGVVTTGTDVCVTAGVKNGFLRYAFSRLLFASLYVGSRLIAILKQSRALL